MTEPDTRPDNSLPVNWPIMAFRETPTNNGYPLAALIVKREIAEAMADKFYFHTYGANPVSCAAGRAVLQVIKTYQLQQRAQQVGAALLDVLRDLQTRHEVIGAVRGHGMMMALEGTGPIPDAPAPMSAYPR